MEPSAFCYWLQASFELCGTKQFTKAQCRMIKRHLALVFNQPAIGLPPPLGPGIPGSTPNNPWPTLPYVGDPLPQPFTPQPWYPYPGTQPWWENPVRVTCDTKGVGTSKETLYC